MRTPDIPILHRGAVPSTNDLLKELLREGRREPLFLAAEEQTAGRGQFARSWLSHQGKGLYLSYLFFPEREKVEGLTKAAAVILSRFLKGYGADVSIKIPNDLMAGGRKIAGILTESVFRGEDCLGVVMGIGLNLFYERRELEEAGIPGTSLCLETDHLFSYEEILLGLTEALKQLNTITAEEISLEYPADA